MCNVCAYNMLVFSAGLLWLAGGVWLETHRAQLIDLFSSTFSIALVVFFIFALTSGCLLTDLSFYREAALAQNSALTLLAAALTLLVCAMELAAVLSGLLMRQRMTHLAHKRLQMGMHELVAATRRNGSGARDDAELWLARLQQQQQCCGCDSPASWNLVATPLPDSCCRWPRPNCAVTDATNASSGVFMRGCLQVFQHWLDVDVLVYGGVALALLLLQVIGIYMNYIYRCGGRAYRCCCRSGAAAKRQHEPDDPKEDLIISEIVLLQE